MMGSPGRIDWNDIGLMVSSTIYFCQSKFLEIFLLYIYGFVIGANEGTFKGYFVVSFDGTGDDVGDPCVGLVVEGITNKACEISLYVF